MPVGRQGNLIVTSTKSVPDSELRARFIEQMKKAHKPYGLYFEDIAGGFTLTMRNMPQAFQVHAADGVEGLSLMDGRTNWCAA